MNDESMFLGDLTVSKKAENTLKIRNARDALPPQKVKRRLKKLKISSDQTVG